MQPRPEESVKAGRYQYVRQRERSILLTAVVDAVLCLWKILSNTVLTVGKLTNAAAWSSGGIEMEAAVKVSIAFHHWMDFTHTMIRRRR